MLEGTSSLHPVRELRPIVAVDLFIALSTECIFRWVFSARFLEVLCRQLEVWNSAARNAFLFQDVICIPFLYMSKSLSTCVTEVNTGAFYCRILVKWTSFLGVREGLQKERLNRGDISSCELGFWVLAASQFLRRNWIRFDQILTAWAFPLQLFYKAYSWYLDCLTFEDGANVSSWYVSNEPPTNASQHPRRTKHLYCERVCCMPPTSALSKSFQSSVRIFLHSMAAMFPPFLFILK